MMCKSFDTFAPNLRTQLDYRRRVMQRDIKRDATGGRANWHFVAKPWWTYRWDNCQ